MSKAVKLSDKQEAFLAMRRIHGTDLEAAQAAGIALNSATGGMVSQWKRRNAEFKELYERIVGDSREVVIKEPDGQNEALEVKDLLTANLKTIVSEHLSLLQNAKSEAVRLKAVELAYDVLKIADGPAESGAVRNIQNVLAVMMPYYQDHAKHGGANPALLGEATMEGQFREVKNGTEERDVEGPVEEVPDPEVAEEAQQGC